MNCRQLLNATPRPRLLDDPYLAPYREKILQRKLTAEKLEERLTAGVGSLQEFALGYLYFGLHRDKHGWVFREWAPNATALWLVGEFSDWRPVEPFALKRRGAEGVWELRLPHSALQHGTLYRLRVEWPGGWGDRIPAYARRVVQDPSTLIFNAQVWDPEQPYAWKNALPNNPSGFLLVYEAHVGMAQEKPSIGTFEEFRRHILTRIKRAGYNALQLMAVLEHPYYGSFGYQVTNFFAVSSRFGTPEEFKALVDEAHGLGLRVIIDLVHSHAAKNEVEGLSRFDGTTYQFFHEGQRGEHPLWDSRCFDYAKPEVLHFLLSNCRFWLDEYRVDGFRFDGITSMLYLHHGLGTVFTHYDQYFDDSVDEDAWAYLALANKLIHKVKPQAITIAEDVSGMPGLAAPLEEGGAGFDYRLAMGVPDGWFNLVRNVRDEDWSLGLLWYELTNRRAEERTISYVECHDQSIVGSKPLMFELADAAMYEHMRIGDPNLQVERAMALHKMARLATLASAGHGYLNFIGNEFGHPDWVDFPREGNGWSFQYARRRWSLRDNAELRYHLLAEFDRAMLELVGRRPGMEITLPRRLLIQEEHKVLGFERNELVLIFNFHPERSLVDYPIPVPPGEYLHRLDTDEPRFGGQGRIASGQCYFCQRRLQNGEWLYHILVYLPARTALVLERVPPAGTSGRKGSKRTPTSAQ
ncbi:MAG: alpha-amylase family glycosyl hydrolase [Kiritimatiellia bacterium]